MIPVISSIIIVAIIVVIVIYAVRKYNNKLKKSVPINKVQAEKNGLLVFGPLLIVVGITLFIKGADYDITLHDTGMVNLQKITNKLEILISGSTAILLGAIMACTIVIKNHINKNLNK